MTKKDYDKIAEGLNKRWNKDIVDFDAGNGPYPDFWCAVDALCIVLKEDNPNFNWDKFLNAIKVKPTH